MNPYIVKYDYENAEGIGVVIIYAKSIDDAMKKFRTRMFESGDSKWYEYVYHRSEFRHVATNVYGWNTCYNESANVCVKIREINSKHGEVIPIYEHFDHDIDI